MINQVLIDYSNQLKQAGLHRKRVLVHPAEVNFSSSDYLSLTQDKRIKLAYQKGFEKYASGSGGSMVVCGYHSIHQELEQTFSQTLAVDASLLFSSGYAANLAVAALLGRFAGNILIDKAVHASFYDGLSVFGAKYSRFLHLDLKQLARKLQASAPNAVVVTETVFSMSGQVPLLPKMLQVCNSHHAELIVDEAHAFGVFGVHGMGMITHYGLTQHEIPLRIIPFGKGMASQGAVVCGKGEWIDALLQLARSSIYSTAMSPALAYGLLETLALIREADERRKKLFELIAYFHQVIKTSPLQWCHSGTPIQQLQLGCPHQALRCAEFLRSKQLFCQPMRAPTVTKQDTGLRVILNYHHEFEDIDRLFFHLQEFYDTAY